jgi:hypothetical protein
LLVALTHSRSVVRLARIMEYKGEWPTDLTGLRGVKISLITEFQTTECMVRITIVLAENVHRQLIVIDEHSRKATPTKAQIESQRFAYR